MKILNILALIFTLVLVYAPAQADSDFKNILLAAQSGTNQENKVMLLVQDDEDYIALDEAAMDEEIDQADEEFENEEDDGC